jgi:6-phosphogluconolactonase
MIRILAITLACIGATLQAADDEKVRVYFGTYTSRGSEGIYLAELDLKTGQLSQPQLAAKVTNPSFLAKHPHKPLLYAVSEVATSEGKKGGGVTAFRIEPETGWLTRINAQPCGGAGPCHLSIDATGQYVLVANYSAGSVSSLPIREDGSLGELVSYIKHEGRSINQQRQEAAHAHSINVDAANRFAIAADLGTDELLVYQLDPAKATLTPQGRTQTPAGGGPRQFAFHPQGKFAYSNNELTSSVSSYRYDTETGKLTLLDTVTTLPHEVAGNTTAEIKVHPNGQFVYVSNRGHNSIALFKVKADGTLAPQGHYSTQGKTPRNFNLFGKYLLAANQDSDDVFVFSIDEASGKLSPTGSSIKVSMPVCVLFVK